MDPEQEVKSVVIPFSGFYESEHTALIDDEIEQIFSDYATGCNGKIPDEVWGLCDYKSLELGYSKEYCENFSAWFRDICEGQGIELDDSEVFTFESLHSPREYNFTTDRIFAEVPLSLVKKLYDAVFLEEGGKAAFIKVIEARFTPCSGFIPFYDNALEPWLAKPIDEWDHNEVNTLLLAYLELVKEDIPSGWELMEDSRGNGAISSLVWDALAPEMRDYANYFSETDREGYEKDPENWTIENILDFEAWKALNGADKKQESA